MLLVDLMCIGVTHKPHPETCRMKLRVGLWLLKSCSAPLLKASRPLAGGYCRTAAEAWNTHSCLRRGSAQPPPCPNFDMVLAETTFDAWETLGCGQGLRVFWAYDSVP